MREGVCFGVDPGPDCRRDLRVGVRRAGGASVRGQALMRGLRTQVLLVAFGWSVDHRWWHHERQRDSDDVVDAVTHQNKGLTSSIPGENITFPRYRANGPQVPLSSLAF